MPPPLEGRGGGARAGVKVGIRDLGGWSRFGVFSCVTRLESNELKCLQAGAVPAEVAAGGGLAGQAGAVENADGGVADRGEQPPGVPGAEPGGVFAEGCVAAVVDWASHCSFTVRGWLEQPVLGGG